MDPALPAVVRLLPLPLTRIGNTAEVVIEAGVEVLIVPEVTMEVGDYGAAAYVCHWRLRSGLSGDSANETMDFYDDV